jgi:hypothetical protein
VQVGVDRRGWNIDEPRSGSHGDPGRRRGEELIGEVDAVLKGGDGGVGELHGITVKLWR